MILILCFVLGGLIAGPGQCFQEAEKGTVVVERESFRKLLADLVKERREFRLERQKARIEDRKERRKWIAGMVGDFANALAESAPLKTLVSGIRYVAWIMGFALAFYVLVRIRTAWETLSKGAGFLRGLIPIGKG